jgi:acetyl esterase/lipase
MKRLTFVAALLFSTMMVSAQDYHITLWDNTTAPTSNGIEAGTEYEVKPGVVAGTSSAEIWIYKPSAETATGQAIVFCPGGGYANLSVQNGHNTCKWFAENGIVGVMLKYRLPNGHSEVPLNDLDKAVATVREMADELGIDPHKVGVSGTSAGGYLAGSAGVMSTSKPDFMILYYPVVSSDADKRHLGTFQRLVGKENVDTDMVKQFSLEKVADSTACPALIFHSDDDKVVPSINAALLYAALKAKGVKASLHIYPSGGHGWGMGKKFKYHETFKAATLDWLKVINTTPTSTK